MTVISKQALLDQIYEDWGSKPQSKICVEILEYLLRSSQASHITYGSLRKVIGKLYNDNELLMAVQYLCGDKTKLFEVKFELLDYDDNYIEVSNAEIDYANETGKLVHPESGEYISDFEDKVYMYFQPSLIVKNIAQ
jgi:hypothetical protein